MSLGKQIKAEVAGQCMHMPTAAVSIISGVIVNVVYMQQHERRQERVLTVPNSLNDRVHDARYMKQHHDEYMYARQGLHA